MQRVEGHLKLIVERQFAKNAQSRRKMTVSSGCQHRDSRDARPGYLDRFYAQVIAIEGDPREASVEAGLGGSSVENEAERETPITERLEVRIHARDRNDKTAEDSTFMAVAKGIIGINRRGHGELGRRKKSCVVNELTERNRSHHRNAPPFRTVGQVGLRADANLAFMTTATSSAPSALTTIDWDYVEFYVGNAKQAAHFYCTAFGFEQIAYAGPETGVKGRVSYLLEQNKLRFLITASLLPDDEIARHVALHGDGVKDIAIAVDDATAAWEQATKAGAESVLAPSVHTDADGRLVRASIATYGDTIHTFVERSHYTGIFAPGFVAAPRSYASVKKPELQFIDHCVGNVGWGQMDMWGDFYHNVFGFSQLVSFDDKDISTEFTALKSKVMTDPRHRVKFPINEPAEGKKKSQIEEFLDFYHGAGVQHIAIRTDDIAATIRALSANGVEFLDTPDSYYDLLLERVGVIDEDIATLRELRILVDRDDQGYMLQIFTKPLQDRPTIFFEIIQRKGSLSFGKGNFKALFVSIEREQEKRGTL